MLATFLKGKNALQQFVQHAYSTPVRYLYSAQTIGMDDYLVMRKNSEIQFKGTEDKFREKMTEFASPKSRELIFTEDLKQVIHIAQPTDTDMELVVNMLKKFCVQCEQLRFGNYVFGPVVMRMFYFVNRPKEALKAYEDKTFSSFFDQISTHIILMDLLFKNDMYSEILQVYEIFRNKQLETGKFQKGIITLVFAACYKLNTVDSMKYVQKLWAEMTESGHVFSGRTVYFAAKLALNQNNPHVALEMVSNSTKQLNTASKSIRILALVFLGRVDDALSTLRSIFFDDQPYRGGHDKICADVIEVLENAVNKSGDLLLKSQFERLQKQLNEYDLITPSTFDSYILTEINFNSIKRFNPRDTMLKSTFYGNKNETRSRFVRRPGLSEMT